MRLLLLLWREDGRRRQNLVKVLELLSRLLLVLIRNQVTIDLRDVREAVHDERTEQHSIRNFVALDRQGGQALQSLQFRNLNETVDVVVLEQESLQVDEALQLRDVRRADDAIEANVLEADLHDGLLEVDVREHLKSVTIDEQQLVALDFSVT